MASEPSPDVCGSVTWAQLSGASEMRFQRLSRWSSEDTRKHVERENTADEINQYQSNWKEHAEKVTHTRLP
jgi:hypothetical protein